MAPVPPRLEAGAGPAGEGRPQARSRAQLRRPAARQGRAGPAAEVYTRGAPYARPAPRGLSASLLADSDVDLDEPAPPPPKPQRPDLRVPYDSSGLTRIPDYDQLREELAREERRRAAVPGRRAAPRRPAPAAPLPETTGSGFQRRELLLRAEQAEERLAPRMEAAYARPVEWDALCAGWLAEESLRAALA